MCIDCKDLVDAHCLQFLQSHRTVQRLPIAAAVLASALPGGVAGEPRYYASNSGKGTAATPDGTLYNMYVVDSTSTECPGLNPGEYALAIPKYSHVKLTVPDSVKNHAWSMRLKYYRPSDAISAKACFLQMQKPLKRICGACSRRPRLTL